MMKRSIGSLTAIMVLLLVGGCGEDKLAKGPGKSVAGQDAAETVAEKGMRVPTWPLVQKNWAPMYYAYGQLEPLEPLDSLEITAPVQGSLDVLNVKPGDTVSYGTSLGSIKSPELDQRMRSQQAELDGALQEYRSQLDKIELLSGQLAEGSAASPMLEAALEEARQASRATHSFIREQDAGFQQSLRSAFYSELVAPVTGKVSSIAVSAGEQIDAGDPVFSLSASQAMLAKVEFDLDRNGDLDANTLGQGMTCALKVPALRAAQFSATFLRFVPDSVAPDATRASNKQTGRKLSALLVLDNPGLHLQAGMSVRARCEGQWRDNIIAMPRKALVAPERSLPTVYVIDDGQARARYPVLGMGDAEHQPVLTGLEQGEELIIGKQQLLEEGDPVQILKWVKVMVENDW